MIGQSFAALEQGIPFDLAFSCFRGLAFVREVVAGENGHILFIRSW
jgi:hypothetical protein